MRAMIPLLARVDDRRVHAATEQHQQEDLTDMPLASVSRGGPRRRRPRHGPKPSGSRLRVSRCLVYMSKALRNPSIPVDFASTVHEFHNPPGLPAVCRDHARAARSPRSRGSHYQSGSRKHGGNPCPHHAGFLAPRGNDTSMSTNTCSPLNVLGESQVEFVHRYSLRILRSDFVAGSSIRSVVFAAAFSIVCTSPPGQRTSIRSTLRARPRPK